MSKAAEYIKSQTDLNPEIAIVLGSGLGNLADSLSQVTKIDYDDIPGFLKTSVKGHKGRLHIGNFKTAKMCICWQDASTFTKGIRQKR